MAELIRTTCQSCQTAARVPADWAGRSVRCKKCGARSTVEAVVVPVEYEVVEDFAPEPVVRRPEAYRRAGGSKRVGWAVAAAAVVAVAAVGGLFAAGVFKSGKANPTAPTGPVKPSGGPSSLAAKAAGSPRRLLFVSINRYVALNPLTAGDTATDAARKMAFEWMVPLEKDNNQLFVLTDMGKDARPAVESVVRPTVERFFATSRAQDRVVFYFGGHAVEKDGKAFLVPSDGDPDDPATLISVADVFARAKACPAQQKVLIFDVCRFNPQFGRQRPGSEPMSEALAKALHSPPAGMQVWTTCSAGENAVELPKTGGEFFAAFRLVADTGTILNKGGLPEESIPVSTWSVPVAKKLGELVAKDGKPAQTPKLTGVDPTPAVANNTEEPPAARFEFPALPKGADPALVASIFQQLALPGVRDDRSADAPDLGSSFYFAEGVMKDYADDGVPVGTFDSDPEKYAVRLAAVDALKTIRDTWTRTKGDGSGRLRETFTGEADEKTKQLIEDEQTVPARIELELTLLLRKLEAAEKLLDKEPSKRWKATFRYAQAQALVRWAYINEYDLMLGAIRKNELPTLNKEKGETGWQMVSVEKMKSKADVKEKAEAAKELFAKIAAEHKGTPWALLARQHVTVAVGLEWRAYNPSEGTVKDVQ